MVLLFPIHACPQLCRQLPQASAALEHGRGFVRWDRSTVGVVEKASRISLLEEHQHVILHVTPSLTHPGNYDAFSASAIKSNMAL